MKLVAVYTVWNQVSEDGRFEPYRIITEVKQDETVEQLYQRIWPNSTSDYCPVVEIQRIEDS